MLSAIYPSLKDKHVAITGGASGIGAGLVAAFARQGASVSFNDVMDQEAGALCDSLASSAHVPAYRHCDLTDLAAVADYFQAIGPVDILVNNAGNDDRHTLKDVSPDYWDDRINVNIRHMLFAAQAVVPAMKAAGKGVIVNFGSISWHLGSPDLLVYQIAKAGIEGMTRGLARELGPDGIRVTCVVPGNVKTPRQSKWYTPQGEQALIDAQCLKGRIMPEDVAALVLFLASDDARLCTGHEYFIDAGWR